MFERQYFIEFCERYIFRHKKIFSWYYSDVISQQVHDLFHEIIFVRVFFVFHGHIQCLSENSYNICSISCADKIERYIQIFYKLVFSLSRSLVNINFVCDHNTGNVRALLAHLFIPALQILISHFTTCIENKNCCVGTKVITWMKFIEWFLTCCVPNI